MDEGEGEVMTSADAVEKERVGDYLVIGRPGSWNVMEQFGSYRMLRKACKSKAAAVKLAHEMNERHPAP